MPVPNAPLILYQNIFRQAPVFASGGNPAHAVDWRLDRAWQPGDGITSIYINEPVQSFTADTLALFGHNLGTIEATVSVRVATPGGSVVPLRRQITSDRCLIFPFTAFSGRFWLVEITAPQPIVIASLCLGTALRLDSGFNPGFTPPDFVTQATVTTTTSAGGLPLGRSINLQPGRIVLNPSNLADPWMRSEWLSFRSHALRYPFFLLWNPEEHPEEAAYCWADVELPSHGLSRPGHFDVSLPCHMLTSLEATP